jgi:hypothetical protein
MSEGDSMIQIEALGHDIEEQQRMATVLAAMYSAGHTLTIITVSDDSGMTVSQHATP